MAEQGESKQDFIVVGIGASAGGLEAAKQFLPRLPADSGMAFVLIQHLDPTHKSMMAALLQRFTEMQVCQADEGMDVLPNHVYVIPPDKVLTIKGSVLHTAAFETRRGLRNPIDQFLLSLAENHAEKAVGIILSGTASDGTQGLKEIKLRGGLTIAQDPQEAQQAGMPNSAIQSGAVDYILPVREIPDVLLHYAQQLRDTSEELENTIEELETSNEELKASKEETLSMNEELQSTNEELETSKEELQSVNEELSTLNTQLQGKVEELENTNNDLDNLINSSDIATLLLDPQLHLKRYTPSTADLLHLRGCDVGRPLSDLVSKVFSEGLKEDAEKVLHDLQPTQREVRSSDGRWFVRRTLPYRTSRNTVEGVVVTFTDVTDLKQAEQELRKSQEQLLQAKNAAAMGIHDFNPCTGAILWDARVRELWGVDAEEPITYEIFMNGLHPDDRESTQRAVEAALDPEGEGEYEAEYRVINRQDGICRWVVATGKVFFDPHREQAVRLVGTVQDITEIKDNQARLEELNNRLEQKVAERTRKLRLQTERLQQLTLELSNAEQRERRRLAQVLHDNLQQLLVAARFKLDIAVNRESEESNELITQAQKLLDDSLDVSHDLALELSPPVLYDSGLKAALCWLGQRMKELHGLHVEVQSEVADGRIPEGLRVLLFTCIRELLLNVVKHSGVRNASVSIAQDEGKIRIVVQDEGKGFVEADVDSHDGSHFGLFHIRQRLESFGGALAIHSNPGEGTLVILSCPVQLSEPIEDEVAVSNLVSAQKNSTATPGTIQLLMVDDHDVVREGLRVLLERQPDFEVIGEAHDGQEAVTLAEQLQPDVVLMDINMPNMDGLEATRIISRSHPHIRILGLSVHDEEAMAQSMYDAGAAGYLSKNHAHRHINQAIRDLMKDPE